MKKILMAAIVLTAAIILIQACTKKEEAMCNEKTIVINDKKMLKISLDFFPESFESQLQLFFDELNSYKNDSLGNFFNYSINNGVWNLTSSMSYLNTNAFIQAESLEHIPYRLYISLNSTKDSIIGNDLLSEALSFNMYIKELESDSKGILLIRTKSIEFIEQRIVLDYDIVRGKIIDYPIVQLENIPIGLPSNAILKMGYPKGIYKSVADEIVKRYNPYLWTALNTGITNPFYYYLVTYISPNQFDGWSNYNNCHNQWPNGDYVLYRGIYGTNFRNAEIYGSRFNTYLERYFNKQLQARINDNLNTTSNIKYLYMECSNNYLSGCNICGYICPDNISSIEYDYTRGRVDKLKKPLNTYTL